MSESQIRIRPKRDADSEYVRQALYDAFASTKVAAHGELVDAAALPGLIALSDGERVGMLTYREHDGLEVVAIVVTHEGIGAGSELLRAIRTTARTQRVRRVWLITTNDNTDALRFYQRNGFDIVAIHRDAVSRSRASIKPEIPETGAGGIPIRHEIELEILL